MNKLSSDSFALTEPARGKAGQKAHPDLVEHSSRLEKCFYSCGPDAWCYVGNGLSNQTFIRGPGGIIAIDTGESIEEMRAALAALREVTDLPIVACIYSHFHYVNGTKALLDERGVESLPIYGHAGIPANLARFGGEVGPRSSRGLVQQFAIFLPEEGEDGQVNVGLGRFYRNPEHSPFSPGYIAPNITFTEPFSDQIAGLAVEMTPAPSDATDSITIWFPELGVCVNNLVWPALFNIFAIRGEEFRDPRILLEGLDHLASLPAVQLIGAHGPPLEGRKEIAGVIEDYADSIRYIWDQTVRGINKGLTLDELAVDLSLPERFERTYFTRQFYGVVEHHVRQIHAGLFGWFDDDPSKLFPQVPLERAQKLVKGFGGVEQVRQAFEEAIQSEDYRWAIELSDWLVKVNDDSSDKHRLATALRDVGQRTTSANIRNWCITRAMELDGLIDLTRFRQHRFGYSEVMAGEPAAFVKLLRVLLDPDKAKGLQGDLCFKFDDGSSAGLTLRNQVAVPTDGSNSSINIELGHESWARLLSGKISPEAAALSGELNVVRGSLDEFLMIMGVFDLWHVDTKK